MTHIYQINKIFQNLFIYIIDTNSNDFYNINDLCEYHCVVVIPLSNMLTLK